MARTNIMKKIKEVQENIPGEHDLPVKTLSEILNNSTDKSEAVANGFYMGFLQGQKAKEAEMKEFPEEIRTRADVRKAIVSSIYKNKNRVTLDYILIISELFRKRLDYKEYLTLSDLEYKQISAIGQIVHMKNPEHVDYVISLIRGLE